MGVELSQRARPSLDGILDLLADLDDEQAALLLQDFDRTTAHKNVPVARAIDLFERSPHPKQRNTCVRPHNRLEKRFSSAPAASRTPRSSSTAALPDVGLSARHAEPPSRCDAATHQPLFSGDAAQTSPRACSNVSRPAPDTPPSPQKPMYKRINRPELPSRTPNPRNPPDLGMLLAAYLVDAPPLSPTLSSASFASLTTLSTLDDDDEDIREPCLDLLEPRRASLAPSVARGLGLGFCGEPAGKIGGIFEVLASEDPGRGTRV